MAQIPKGRLVKGPYKPICRDCAIYFSTTVFIYIYTYLYHLKIEWPIAILFGEWFEFIPILL